MEIEPQQTVDKVKILSLSTSETSEQHPLPHQLKKKIKKMSKKEELDKQANKAHLLLEWRSK